MRCHRKKIISLSGSTYICEQTFSLLTVNKSRMRTKMTKRSITVPTECNTFPTLGELKIYSTVAVLISMHVSYINNENQFCHYPAFAHHFLICTFFVNTQSTLRCAQYTHCTRNVSWSYLMQICSLIKWHLFKFLARMASDKHQSWMTQSAQRERSRISRVVQARWVGSNAEADRLRSTRPGEWLTYRFNLGHRKKIVQVFLRRHKLCTQDNRNSQNSGRVNTLSCWVALPRASNASARNGSSEQP